MSTALERYPYVAGYTDASLPVHYEAAKQHLAQCERVDECKEWKDKAEALRSYARQAHDDELYRMATKIQNRARVRMDQLLKQIPKQQGRRTDLLPAEAPGETRGQVARSVGITRKEQRTIEEMGRVPEAKREELIERGATATEIAEEGRNYDDSGHPRARKTKCLRCKKLFPLDVEHDCTPPGYKLATKLLGDLSRLDAFLREANPRQLTEAMSPVELASISDSATFVVGWLNSFKREAGRARNRGRKK